MSAPEVVAVAVDELTKADDELLGQLGYVVRPLRHAACSRRAVSCAARLVSDFASCAHEPLWPVVSGCEGSRRLYSKARTMPPPQLAAPPSLSQPPPLPPPEPAAST